MDSPKGQKTPHILLLEDDKAHQDLVSRAFRDDPETVRLSVAGTIRKAREILLQDPPDLIIADWILPDGKGIEILPRTDGMVTVPLIIMTSFGDEHLAVEIMKSGAIDYVVKSSTLFKEMPHIARRALRDWENIHERKRAEASVQDSQKRLADILNFLPDATLAIDNDGRVIVWNNAIERMTGIMAADMLGKGDHEYSIPFYGVRRPILIDLVLMDDSEIEKKYDYIRRDNGRITSETFIPALFSGKGAYLWGTAAPLFDRAGNRVGAIEVIRDITDRKQAEVNLQKREATLKTLLNAPHDTIALLDRQGILVGSNTEGARRLGGTVKDVTGKYVYDLLPPDIAQARKERIDHVFATGQPAVFDDFRSGMHLHNEIFPIFNPEHSTVDQVAVFARDVTDKKTAELALQESEDKFRYVFDHSVIGKSITRPTGEISVNRALCDMLGYSEGELKNHTWQEITHPDDIELTRKMMDALIAGESESKRFVKRYIHKNGSVVWTDVGSSLRRDKDGRPLYFITSILDITERKRAEDALKESEERLLMSQEIGHIGGWEYNLKTNEIWGSAEGARIYGLHPVSGDFPIDTIEACIPERERVHQALVDLIQYGKEYNLEFAVNPADGSLQKVIMSTARLEKDDQGNPARVVGIIQDITLRKRAEEKLRESEERYRSLLTGSGIGVGYWSPDGTLLFLNDISLARLKGKEEDFIGKNMRDLFRDNAEMYIDRIQRAVKSSDPMEYEDYVRLPAGTGWYLSVYSRINGPDGSARGVQVISMDITERKRNEEIRNTYETRLDSAMEIGSLAWWEMDLPDGAVRFDNRKASMLGYSPDKFRHYADFTSLLHPEDLEPAMQAMRDHLEGKVPRYHVDYRIRAADGNYRWFRDVGGITLRNQDGSPRTITGIVIDITAAKLAEEALHASEIRFRALIQNASDIIRILDKDGRVVYESASADRILGYPPGFLIGKDPFDYIHPDDAGLVRTELSEVYDGTNTGVPTEFRVRKANGEYIWVDSIGTNLLDVSGVNGIVITTRPIQQRKEAEKQIAMTLARLERSEALLRKVYDILPIGLWLADKNGKLLYGNPAGVKIWGAEPLVPIEQYGIFRARRFPSGEEIAAEDWALAHTIHEGVTIKDEMLEIDTFDGKKKIILNFTAPLYDTAGAIDGAIVVNQEITDKVNAEQALMQNRARLATAMDIAGLVNWEYEVASGMFTFDDRFYALYETTADREGGNHMSAETYLREFVYPDDRLKVLETIRDLLATTDPAYIGQMEHRITPRDGSIRTIVARYAPVMGPEGKVIRTYGANQDITDFKLMESEIRSLNTVLEQRVKERTEALSLANASLEEENAQRLTAEQKLQVSYNEKVILLKEIHHRVKNNLQIIASLLNLQSRYIKDESTLAAIRESQNRVKAMALVHEKLYRSEDIANISLHDYIKFLGTGLFQFYDARSRGIQFHLDITDVNVDIDAAIPLGLILNELISNSLKYAYPNGRTGEIAISVKKEGHTITVIFRDTGIGIPADFDWQNSQSLGLRLVNTLVDQMSGTIELDRSTGTQFTMVMHEKKPGGSS